MSEVECGLVGDLEQLPDCDSTFGNLRHCFFGSEQTAVPSAWPLAWMLAAACTGYRYARGRIRPLNAAPVDLSIIVQTIKSVTDSLSTGDKVSYIQYHQEELPDEGKIFSDGHPP